MLYPNTKMLYKYTTAKRIMEILQTGNIYYPTLKKLNDPFDSKILINQNDVSYYKKTKIKKLIKKNLEANFVDADLIEFFLNDQEKAFELSKAIIDSFNEAISVIAGLSEKFGILSFSGDRSNMLLWSHYADSHKGDIICFERSDNNDLGDQRFCFPVNYSSYVPEINDVDIGVADLWKKRFGNKDDIWAYEKEWRLISKKGDELGNLPGKIRAVVCGMKMSSDALDQVNNLAREQGIDLLVSREKENSYKCEINESD